jgi:pilus assembly protein Flp/PilA
MSFIRKIVRNQKGATAIEYGLIAALIAVAAIAAMKNIGTSLGTTFNNVSTQIPPPLSCPAPRSAAAFMSGTTFRRRFHVRHHVPPPLSCSAPPEIR